MPVLVTIGLVVLAAALIAWAFNGLVTRRVRTREAWSQIDVQLERRHDLIPNLVETVKGYATHERGTFEAVTTARDGALSARAGGDPAIIGQAEDRLTGSLRTLLAVAEAYPQLRAVDSFLALQEELIATEDRLAFARHYYNASVRDYTIATQTFPRSLLARASGFVPMPFFQAEDEGRVVPRVELGRSALPPAV